MLAGKWVHALESSQLLPEPVNKRMIGQAEPVVCRLAGEELSDAGRWAYLEMPFSGRQVLSRTGKEGAVAAGGWLLH